MLFWIIFLESSYLVKSFLFLYDLELCNGTTKINIHSTFLFNSDIFLLLGGTEMNFINHFKTITAHKLLVMKYCFKLGLYKQGLLHDL